MDCLRLGGCDHQLTPVRSRFAKLVGEELIDECLPKIVGVLLVSYPKFDRTALLASRFLAHRLRSSNCARRQNALPVRAYSRVAPHDYNAHGDCPVSVQPFKILEIAIKEWIFVVPLDLQRQNSA